VSNKKGGFSLLELLFVLAISGILLGLAGVSFAKQRQKGDITRISQELGQNIRLARAQALSKSTTMSIRIGDRKRYFLYEWDDATNSWRKIKRIMLNGKGLFDQSSTHMRIVFDSRGYADFRPANTPIIIRNDTGAQEILVSMTGSIIIRDLP